MQDTPSTDQRAVLSRCPLFLNGGEALLDRVLNMDGCSREEFPVGAELYRPDRFRRSLGVLLSGRLRVTKGTLTVSELGPSALFGAAALYHSAPEYATTLTAAGPCSCLFLEEVLLDRLLGEEPLLRRNYLTYLSGRIWFLSARLQSLAAGDTQGRVVRYLLDTLADGVVECSAAELARRLGISRASLYRAFQQLEQAGFIVRRGRVIRVPDPAALSAAW